MSTTTLPWTPTASVLEAQAAATATVRAPAGIRATESTISFDYTPDLTAEQVTAITAAVANVVGVTRARNVTLTYDEYVALAAFLATGRTFVAQSQAQFMALTQAQRDRMLFDNVTALWRVIFRLLRD
jgi:hypothetical protein